MISIAYFLIFFPFRITFGLHLYDYAGSYICAGIVTSDIVVCMNTGFYSKGALVSERIGICMHYMNTRLLLDFITLIPFVLYDFSNISTNLFSDRDKFIESFLSVMFLIRISHLG